MEPSSSPSPPLRVLEFYSGIGGMRYSLEASGAMAEVVAAFDINDVANDVYELNFGHRPIQGNIQKLTAGDLDKHEAHAWFLSPPCQPYTRQGLQKDSADARASSFIKILQLMQHMTQPPQFLFVENVVGFEISDTHRQLVEVLTNLDFVLQEFILSPLQFGVPYSRPRYFCLAKRKPLCFLNPSSDHVLVQTPHFLLSNNMASPVQNHINYQEDGGVELACQPILEFLEAQSLVCSCSETSTVLHEGTEDSSSSLCSQHRYMVPPSTIERWGTAMDIVYSSSTRCCCFTKSYYRYVKGTGSLLVTSRNSKLMHNDTDVSSLKELGLRFFTPREVANLHSFPAKFQFPDHISLRQQYAMLGNSLSVAVVAPLLSYLFAGDPK